MRTDESDGGGGNKRNEDDVAASRWAFRAALRANLRSCGVWRSSAPRSGSCPSPLLDDAESEEESRITRWPAVLYSRARLLLGVHVGSYQGDYRSHVSSRVRRLVSALVWIGVCEEPFWLGDGGRDE